jgi:hypothetical protein
MLGQHQIVIQNARVQFKLTLTRSLTLLRGNSATGKSTLIDMVAEYERDGFSSGISVSSPAPCCVLTGKFWHQRLSEIENSFVFIDEGEQFITTHEFAHAIKGSSNYYVIATREKLPMLPYSVDEIYEIKNVTSRYPNVRKFYSQNKRLYSKSKLETVPDLVIVEDSNSGFEFWRAVCAKAQIACVSANGKSNVARALLDAPAHARHILVVADGAAFGPEMEQVHMLAQQRGADLFLPESFEHMVLSSGLVRAQGASGAAVADILANPAAFIDSQQYFSWENFFTDELVSATAGTYLQYSKAHLNDAYLADAEFAALKTQLPYNMQ